MIVILFMSFLPTRHRRESLQHRQTVSRPPPTEEELRWAREGFSWLESFYPWSLHCDLSTCWRLSVVKPFQSFQLSAILKVRRKSEGQVVSQLLRPGHLLKHSAGLCLRSSEEDGDGTLMLLSCSFPPVGPGRDGGCDFLLKLAHSKTTLLVFSMFTVH